MQRSAGKRGSPVGYRVTVAVCCAVVRSVGVRVGGVRQQGRSISHLSLQNWVRQLTRNCFAS